MLCDGHGMVSYGCCMVWYETLRGDMVWYGCGMTWCRCDSMVWHGCGVAWYRCGTIWYGMVQLCDGLLYGIGMGLRGTLGCCGAGVARGQQGDTALRSVQHLMMWNYE